MKRRSSGSTDDSDEPLVDPPVVQQPAQSRNSAPLPKQPAAVTVAAGAASRSSSARSRRSNNPNWKLEHGPNANSILDNHPITALPSSPLSVPSLAAPSPAYRNHTNQLPNHKLHHHSQSVADELRPTPNDDKYFDSDHDDVKGDGESLRDGIVDTRREDQTTMTAEKMPDVRFAGRRSRFRSPWSVTIFTLTVTVLGITLLCAILNSSWTRQLDAKGCRMSYMRPSYIRLRDFDTEHTRFATKYSLYLYREQGVDDERKVRLVSCARAMADR